MEKKAGIILTEEEVEQIYYTIVDEGNLCGLMDFITINKIIDEEIMVHFNLRHLQNKQNILRF